MHRGSVMHFRTCCENYMATHFYKLSTEDLEFIVNSAKVIAAPKGATYIVVPMHCLEENLEYFLKLMIPQAKKNNATIVVLFNGDAKKIHYSKFTKLRSDAEGVLQSARFLYSYDNVYMLSQLLSGSVGMGRIRGLLCDAAMLNAYMHNVQHPIFISVDIDLVEVSDEFVASYTKIFESDSNIKMSAGEVNYGYFGDEAVCLPDGVHIPELYIFNELNKAILRCARNGCINYEYRIWLEGANMAFSAAAYCACGGFDFEKKSGEDDCIARALHRYNPNVFSRVEITEDIIFKLDPVFTSKFNDDGWCVTSPRRILQAISAHQPGIEAWADRPFMENLGAGLSSDDLALQCSNDPGLITISDLRKARDPDNLLFRRDILEKLSKHLYRSIEYDRKARNAKQITRVLTEVGVQFISCDGDSQFSQIDWENSTLINTLLRMAGNVDDCR